jgi:hypothetical protein
MSVYEFLIRAWGQSSFVTITGPDVAGEFKLNLLFWGQSRVLPILKHTANLGMPDASRYKPCFHIARCFITTHCNVT